MRRRTYIGATVATIPFVGCVGLIGPDPVVVDADANQSISGTLSGTVDFRILVRNDGQSGDIEVTLRFKDSAGTTVGRESRMVPIDEDERRLVEITTSVPSSADRFEVEADASTFL